MRVSALKSAAFALLGLGSILPGVLAAPSPAGVRSLQSANANLLAKRKDLPDLPAMGYKIATEGPAVFGKQRYIITKPDAPKFKNNFAVTPKKNRLDVQLVDKRDDKGKVAHTSDQAMYLWVNEGKKPAPCLVDLYFEAISEEKTQKDIKEAFDTLKLGSDMHEFTVNKNDEDEKKKVWESLIDTPFGKWSTRWVKEYDTSEPEKIAVTGGRGQPNMEIFSTLKEGQKC